MVKNPPVMQQTQVNPWVGKISWKKKWQPTPGFLPGKSHGWRSLAGYSPWGHKRVGHSLVSVTTMGIYAVLWESWWLRYKLSACNAGDPGSMAWDSCLENPMDGGTW